MPRYYKATRPDGTDFHTGRLLYQVGEVTEHPGELDRNGYSRMVTGDPATYLSISTTPTDCTGFSWPCRLFHVKPIGQTIPAPSTLPNKVCCLSLRVVEELPSWQVFGPYGEFVVAVIEKAGTVTYKQRIALDAAWDAALGAAWDAALGAAWGAALDAAWGAALDAALGAARDAALGAAWGAARGAALSLLVADKLSDQHFDKLYGPWCEVMGSVEVAL